MTIKQILDASQAHPDAEFQIDGVDVGVVSLAALLSLFCGPAAFAHTDDRSNLLAQYTTKRKQLPMYLTRLETEQGTLMSDNGWTAQTTKPARLRASRKTSTS